MRILLIQPAKPPVSIGGDDVFLFEPLALEYVAAGVSGTHEVKILDMRLESDLESVLHLFDPQVVGITSYTIHVNVVRNLFAQVKQAIPEALTVVGGHHATVAPEDFISPYIDVIVEGEGVSAFAEIVNRFGGGEGFAGIPGVTFARGEPLVNSAPDTAIDLDSIPLPDRALTTKYRKRYYSQWMKPLASIRTSKGCPFRCNFCALWKLTGGRYLKRTPENIVRELSEIDEEYVFFADDESLVDASRMKKLALLIERAGIHKQYFLYARSDTIARNHELLSLWKRIGLEKVFVGLEFFRDADFEAVGKGTSIADNDKALEILDKLGIEPYASFIVRPDLLKDDFTAFRRYCRGLALGFAGFAVLTPLPGTDLYEQSKEQLITSNWDYFDFIHTVLPTKLPLKEFYDEYYKLSRQALSPTKALAYLSRYRLSDIPGTLIKSYRFYNRLRRAYRDYETPSPVTPEAPRRETGPADGKKSARTLVG
jgi:radical SAM superfamily enzyme YgiQ (UPF0313 family)